MLGIKEVLWEIGDGFEGLVDLWGWIIFRVIVMEVGRVDGVLGVGLGEVLGLIDGGVGWGGCWLIVGGCCVFIWVGCGQLLRCV